MHDSRQILHQHTTSVGLQINPS